MRRNILSALPWKIYSPFATVLLLAGCGGGGKGGSNEDRMLAAARARAQAAKPAETAPPAAATATPAAATPGAPDALAPAAATPMANATAATATPAVAGESAVDGAFADPAKNPLVAPPADPLNMKDETAEKRMEQSVQNLLTLARGFTQYTQANLAIPPVAITEKKTGRPLLSWRVAILPYLGHKELYEKFHLSEPWDSPHNLTLLPLIPKEFQSPDRNDTSTNYLAALAGESAFSNSPTLLKTISDGVENTLAVVEADNPAAVPWTSPKDFSVNSLNASQGLGKLRSGEILFISASGEVSKVLRTARPGTIDVLISPRGGEDPIPDSIASLMPPPEAQGAENGENGEAIADAGPPGISMSASELPGTSINGLLNSEPQPAKLPLPTESELEKSRGLLKELYAAEFAAARSFEERQSFLAHLMTESEKIKDNTSDYHELLFICRKLAISLGNVPVAVSAVDRLHSTFALEDPMGLRLKTLEEIAANSKSDDINQNLALGAERLLLDAYENDQFTVALAALEVYKNATKGRLSKGEQNQIASTKEAMEEAQKNYAAASKALLVLTTNPGDPLANFVAGRYLCLVKGKWEAGLPMLARGNDIQLQVLARLDQEAKDSNQLLYLAEEYVRASINAKQPFKRGMQLRATRCYHLAIQNLASGLERVKAQKRLAEATTLYGKEAVDRACGILPGQTVGVAPVKGG